MRVPYGWLMEYVDTDASPEELAHVLTMGGLEVEEIEDWTSEDGQASDKVLITSVTSNRGDLLSMIGVARHAAALLDVEFTPPEMSLPATDEPIRADDDLTEGDTRVQILDLEGCPRYSALRVTGVEVGPSPEWLAHRLEAAGIRPISNVVDATNYVVWETGQPLHAFDHRLLIDGHIIVRRAEPGERMLTIDDQWRYLTPDDLVICDPKGPVALAGIMGGLDSEVRKLTKDVLLESAHFNPTLIRRTSQRLPLSTEASYRFERYVDPNLTLPALARAAQLILDSAGGEIVGPALDVRTEEFELRAITMRPDRCNAVLGTDLSGQEMEELLKRLGLEVRMQYGLSVRGVETYLGGGVPVAEEDREGAPGRPPVKLPEPDALLVTVPTHRPDLEREIDLIEEVAIVHGYDSIPMTLPRAGNAAAVLTREQKLERRVREMMRAAGVCESLSFSMMGQHDLDSIGLPEDAPERSALRLRDPVSAHEDLMRTTLLPSLFDAARDNVRQRVQDVALFEVSRVFLPAPPAEGKPSAGEEEGAQAPRGLPEERRRLGAIVMGSVMTSGWNLPAEVAEADFYWLKGLVEQLCRSLGLDEVVFERARHPSLHPGRSAQLLVSGEYAGALGEVAPEVRDAYDLQRPAYVMELDLEVLFQHAQLQAHYEPVPRMPAALRDLALVVPDDEEHDASTLTTAVEQAAGDELASVEVFDVYEDPERLGAGNKQIALRLTFRHPERTLTDDEVDALMRTITQRLERDLSARVRDW